MTGDSTPWLSDQQERLWRDWVRLGTRLPAALNRQLQAAGLSLADFEVLVMLTDVAGGRLRLTDLAEQMHWERSRLSHQVRRMGQRGLLERQMCDSDGRVAYVAITAAGRTAIEEAAPGHATLVQQMFFAGLSQEQSSALRSFFAGALARLDDAEAGNS